MPVSKSTLHRVIGSVDPEQVEAVLRRFAMPRLALGQAIAVDGKRIRGANRHARHPVRNGDPGSTEPSPWRPGGAGRRM